MIAQKHAMYLVIAMLMKKIRNGLDRSSLFPKVAEKTDKQARYRLVSG